MRTLRLVTLYLSERCNSRCTTCDYWRHGRQDMSLDTVRRMLPALRALGTEVALLSGGEPLLNPEWQQIARSLRDAGLRPWLLTAGLSLAKHSARIASLFDAVTVSLDGTTPETYAAIRGLDAFETVCSGIRALVAAGMRPGLRVTVQRTNFRELPSFVELAHSLGAREVSFLAVDVANLHAFGRAQAVAADAALTLSDLPDFDRTLDLLERDHAEDFRSGFIAESPQKLRRMVNYFGAVQGKGTFPRPRCNAPEFSTVIDAALRVRPCFFIAGPGEAQLSAATALTEVLQGSEMRALRSAIALGQREECATCVCPLWRDASDAGVSLIPQTKASAA